MTSDDVELREATSDDQGALVEALHHAVNWEGVERFSVADILADPHLAGYVTGWPRPGDFGVVAVAGGVVVGTAWCRSFTAQNPGFGYVADDVPEVSMGVAADRRGRGLGSALLDRLVAQARERSLHRLSLSVEDGNRARNLYERMGFTPVGREGGSDTMVLTL